MKICFVCMLYFAVAAGIAGAQSAVNPSEDSSAGALPPVVYAENTVNPDEARKAEAPAEKPLEQPAKQKAAVHYEPSFNSESSADTIVDHVVKTLSKDSSHACEVVKEAIVVSKANEKLVARIVEAACMAAPDKMRIIAQCAVAASPDSLSSIQLVMAKLDPGAGDDSSSSKDVSAKGGMDDKGGKMVTTAPPVIYDPLRRAYFRPNPPVYVEIPPATRNSVPDYEDDDEEDDYLKE